MLEMIPYKAKKNEDINGHGMKGAEQNNSNGTSNKKIKKTLLVVIIIPLLITTTSLALSVAAYNQSKSELLTVQNQQSNDLTAVQTQLAITCSNVSRMLFQVDTDQGINITATTEY